MRLWFDAFGPSRRRRGASWRHLGGVLAPALSVLAPSWAVLALYWPILAPFWNVLGASWTAKGANTVPTCFPTPSHIHSKNHTKIDHVCWCLLGSRFFLLDSGEIGVATWRQAGTKIKSKSDLQIKLPDSWKYCFMLQEFEAGRKHEIEIEQKMLSEMDDISASIFDRSCWIWEGKLGWNIGPTSIQKGVKNEQRYADK